MKKRSRMKNSSVIRKEIEGNGFLFGSERNGHLLCKKQVANFTKSEWKE